MMLTSFSIALPFHLFLLTYQARFTGPDQTPKTNLLPLDRIPRKQGGA
jgi:hypothetical protein